MLRRVVVTGVMGGLLAASSARAQTAPAAAPEQHSVAIETPPAGAVRTGDTVVLKDGTTLRGSIREMTPGQAVTITLTDGQTRTIEWNAIERVDIDRARPVVVASGAPTQMVPVHLEGAYGVVLQALDERGTEGQWRTVCNGACDQDLPTDGLYRVDGPGLRTSKPFRLQGSHPSYRVDQASSLGFAGGLTLVIVGGLALVNGIGLLVLAAVYQNQPGYIVPDSIPIAGAILTAGGVGALIPGIFLMKGNSRTTVTASDGSTPPPVRVPAWREAPMVQALRLQAPPMIGVPLWSGTF